MKPSEKGLMQLKDMLQEYDLEWWELHCEVKFNASENGVSINLTDLSEDDLDELSD